LWDILRATVNTCYSIFGMQSFTILSLLYLCTGVWGRETGCPLIHAKSAEECSGRVSDCWSPNTFDVDCNNGADLCCFDGCVNVCDAPKECETVYKTRFKSITTEDCRTEEQSPVCTAFETQV
jgi:hypothetical protein